MGSIARECMNAMQVLLGKSVYQIHSCKCKCSQALELTTNAKSHSVSEYVYIHSFYYNCLRGAPVRISAIRDRIGWKCHRQSFSLSSHPLLIAECDRLSTFQQKQSVGVTPLTKIKMFLVS